MDKTIIILTPGFAASENDSSSLPYLQDFVSGLIAKTGADKVKIIPLHYPYTRKRFLWKGVEVIPVKGKNRKGLFRLIIFSRVVSIIKKIINKNACIIHSFWLTDASFIGNYIAKKFEVPLIATMMGQDAKPENKMLQLLDLSQMKLVGLSENQANIFFDSTGRKPDAIIPFGIPAADHTKMKPRRAIDILFVGSFISIKHPELFVELIRQLKHDFANINTVMIGDGHLWKEIQNKILELSLENNITLTGNLPREDVFEYMGNSKILLHTSEYEGQCVVFAEALAYGMHVVSFRVGDIERTDKHIICSTLEDMNIQLYKLLNSGLTFESYQPFTNERTADKYLELYNSTGK